MFQHPRNVTLIGAAYLLLSLHTSLVAQTTATPSAPAAKKPAADLGTFFKQHWIDRVKEFREQNKQFRSQKLTSPNVVLVGDSITEGFNVKTLFPDRQVLNRGIGADVIGNALPKSDKRGILRRLDASVFDCIPGDVFLLIGINDLGSGHSPEVIESGYRDILQRVKKRAPDVRLHVQSVLPTRDKYAKHNANVNDVNRRLKKLTKEFGYDYIDLHSQMADEKGELKKEFTRDGLHLNPEAYKVWKAEIERTLGW